MSAASRVTLEQGLEAARTAEGNTVLVLVSPRQAERLYLAIKLADKLVAGDLEGCTMLAIRYEELSK